MGLSVWGVTLKMLKVVITWVGYSVTTICETLYPGLETSAISQMLPIFIAPFGFLFFYLMYPIYSQIFTTSAARPTEIHRRMIAGVIRLGAACATC